LRVVSEVNGENIQNQRANDSALLGLIWQPTSKNLSFDAAVRRGITRAAPDWQFTLGLTLRIGNTNDFRQRSLRPWVPSP